VRLLLRVPDVLLDCCALRPLIARETPQGRALGARKTPRFFLPLRLPRLARETPQGRALGARKTPRFFLPLRPLMARETPRFFLPLRLPLLLPRLLPRLAPRKTLSLGVRLQDYPRWSLIPMA